MGRHEGRAQVDKRARQGGLKSTGEAGRERLSQQLQEGQELELGAEGGRWGRLLGLQRQVEEGCW